jgi:phospholipase/lecithinase/hemolysin
MNNRSIIGQGRILLFIIALTASSAAWAISFSNIYIFGDSLSDTTARVTNGLMWPEYLAPQLGIPSYDPAANFAISGATSFDLASQLTAYQSINTVTDPDALYVVWAGGNDILDFGNEFDAANNVISTVNTLSSMGANNILVPNLPDLELAPVGSLGSFGTPVNNFNSILDSTFSSSLNVTVADVFGFHHAVYDDPAAFGLTNVTEACTFLFFTCPNPSEYLFWDIIHPTTVGHSLIADEFFATVVPVPAAFWLFGSGFLGLIGFARQNKA